jgi:hypothetical protein
MLARVTACCLLLVCVLIAACSSAPNSTYGQAPSYVQQWIPQGCTDQNALPWAPYFQAGNGNSQLSGLGVQTLRCGHVWRFLAWDVDPSHNYHELSAPGRTDCPNGNERFTSAAVLIHDPYNGSFVAVLEESGSGNNWAALQVSMTQTMDDSSLYPPHCPQEKAG